MQEQEKGYFLFFLVLNPLNLSAQQLLVELARLDVLPLQRPFQSLIQLVVGLDQLLERNAGNRARHPLRDFAA